MRLSEMVGKRYKERPAEATLESHAFLLRGGYARQVANGIYSLLPPGLRVVRKIERIVREEMDRVGGQEVLMPVTQPRELWEESGRYTAIGPEMARFQDRTGHDMVLAMTHEEAVVHLCRHEVNSHAQFPFMVYQLQTKFRDEPRSRGGLIRVREFTMKDAYSFHTSAEDLEAYYRRCYRAYERIFARAGIPEVVVVQSDSGMMGGKIAHEFMLLTDAGEDTIVTSEDGAYLANQEVACGRIEGFPEDPKPIEKVHTPNCRTIEEVAGFLGVDHRRTAKAVFYDADAEGRLVLVAVRGDREVNESKLARIIGKQPVPASEDKIRKAGCEPGFASPIGISPEVCRVVVDHTVAASNNLVTGANEPDYHFVNFNLERDCPGTQTVDVVDVEEGDLAPEGHGRIVLKRGIEVGNIFQLGTKYTESMGMTYNDETGQARVPIMGCYGIGVGRMMSSAMEARRDEYGPIWPMSIAPWQIHLNAIKLAAPGVRETAETLYRELSDAGLEVVFDDRDERAGVQFADADLLGVPIRVIVSERNLKSGQLEWKRRDTGEQGAIPVESAAATLAGWVRDALQAIEDKVPESV